MHTHMTIISSTWCIAIWAFNRDSDILNYSWLIITGYSFLATKIKVSQKLSNKDDFISVDHKAFKKVPRESTLDGTISNWFFLGSLQHVLCMGLIINFYFQDVGMSQHLEDEVPHNVTCIACTIGGIINYILPKLARKYLCIPASANIECIFLRQNSKLFKGGVAV